MAEIGWLRCDGLGAMAEMGMVSGLRVNKIDAGWSARAVWPTLQSSAATLRRVQASGNNAVCSGYWLLLASDRGPVEHAPHVGTLR